MTETQDTNTNEPMNGSGSDSGSGTDPKMIGIIAYITIIGWIVALVLNMNNKTEYASFHIRQMLGLVLLGVVLGIIPIINIIGWIFVLVLWVIGLIGAIQGEKKQVPLVGKFFQDIFKSL